MMPHRRVGNVILTAWIRYVTRLPISDGQSGYRALSLQAARSLEIAHDYNYAQVMTVDLAGKGFGYREVPITYSSRSTGTSFVRLGPYLLHVLPAVARRVRHFRRLEQSPGLRDDRGSGATPVPIATRVVSAYNSEVCHCEWLRDHN